MSDKAIRLMRGGVTITVAPSLVAEMRKLGWTPEQPKTARKAAPKCAK